MTVEDDYVTVLPTVDPYKFLVVVMIWSSAQDGWVQAKCSRYPMSRPTAEALAQSWAAAKHVEVRL